MTILVMSYFCNEMSIPSINLNNINYEDVNDNDDDPEIIIHVRLLAWRSEFEKCHFDTETFA